MYKRLAFLMLLAFPMFLMGITDWKTVSTDYFVVYYKTEMEPQALDLLQTMEHHRSYVEQLCGSSRKKIPILIEDIGFMANGYANPVGNSITLFNHFPTDGSLAFLEDWWTEVGVHEYIHILQMTNEGGTPKVLRMLFGNLFHTNILVPGWIVEGITVYGESNYSPYSGRLNAGNYPAIVRTVAAEAKLPSATKASYFSSDTPLGNIYVYGSSFFQYLAGAYGEDKFAEFFKANGANLTSFISPLLPNLGIDKIALEVYGKTFPQLWEDWQIHEQQLAEEMIVAEEQLTSNGWLKARLRAVDEKLYYTQMELIKTSTTSGFGSYELIQYDPQTKQHKTLLKQRGEFPSGYQIHEGQLYYSRNELRRGYANVSNLGFGFQPELWQKDLDTGARKRIYRGSFRAFYIKADGSILIAKDSTTGTGSQILQLSADTEKVIHDNPDQHIHSIHEHDGRLFVSARRFWRNSSIFELKDNALIPLIDTPLQEAITGFDGDNLIFDANYEEFTHSYLYNLQDATIQRLSGADYMSDAQIIGGDVYYLSMSSLGYELCRDSLHPVLYEVYEYEDNPAPYTPVAQTPDPSSLDHISFDRGGYLQNLLHLINPRQARMPVFYTTEESFLIGCTLSGSDVIGHFPFWQTSLMYESKPKKFRFDLMLENQFFSPLSQSIYYSTVDEQTLSLDQRLPLILRNNYGLNSLDLGFSILTKENFERKIWTPYLESYINIPGFNNVNRIFSKIEEKQFTSSDRERFGFGSIHNFRALLPRSSQLVSANMWTIDPDADSDEVFEPIRGYSDGLVATKGFISQNTVSRVIAKVRSGIWSPQFYLEDISAGLFFDLAAPASGQGIKTQYSYGAEVAFEVSALFWASSSAGFRLSLNREDKFLPTMFFAAGF